MGLHNARPALKHSTLVPANPWTSSQATGCCFSSSIHWLSRGCWPGFYFELEFPLLGSLAPHPQGPCPGSLLSAPPCPWLWNPGEFQAHPPSKSNEKKTQGHSGLYLLGSRFCEPSRLLLGDTKVTFTQEAPETRPAGNDSRRPCCKAKAVKKSPLKGSQACGSQPRETSPSRTRGHIPSQNMDCTAGPTALSLPRSVAMGSVIYRV